MPKVTYVDKRFHPETAKLIDQANDIIAEYQADGYTLTVRQLYYQFVARDLVENTMKSYKRMASIINDARLAGLIDWQAIEDRTRSTTQWSHWTDPGEIIDACAEQYRVDKWVGQSFRPEVWIEKEALAGVMERVCRDLDIPFLSCRGYTSQSEMWTSAMRLHRIATTRSVGRPQQTPIILHFGDHDPSGLDMTRDITERLAMFMGGVKLTRLALNMNQVERYKPPANPAKVTDSRFADYEVRFGNESWELDALDPKVLANLVRAAVDQYRDPGPWEERLELERDHRARLKELAENWQK
jgi:hypothetical protein